MIKYIKREDLDILKYNTCIDNAFNTRIYAYSWYLDIVATNWDALILDDYRAVMPLPWRQKYFIKYIYKPSWTQQLGVFSAATIDEELVQKFIKAIPKKFRKITIQFNSDNPISGKGVTKKVNYILPLDKTYLELFRGYKYVRRRSKRQAMHENGSVYIEASSHVEEIITLFKEEKQEKVLLDNTSYTKLEELIYFLKNNNKVEILVAKDKKEKLLGGAFFLIKGNRITYLFSSVSKKGREENIMSFIIDSVVEKYAETNYTLDFEGSMIEGIAFFFRSFGAEDEGYYLLEKSLL